MSRLIKSLSVAFLLLSAPVANAQDFFSTASAAEQFNIGVHFGVNTSNRTITKDAFPTWNVNSWGTGVALGATVDINFRDWISVQPGFFFDSRSGNYAYVYPHGLADGSVEDITQLGHGRSYNFNIPVLASVHFNVSNDVRWNVELGPYVQFSFANSFSNKAEYPLWILAKNSEVPAGTGTAKTRGFDFGFKMGSGITILDHYNFSVHYLAGCLNAWKPSALAGRNKEWVFSVGYIF